MSIERLAPAKTATPADPPWFDVAPYVTVQLMLKPAPGGSLSHGNTVSVEFKTSTGTGNTVAVLGGGFPITCSFTGALSYRLVRALQPDFVGPCGVDELS